MSKRTGIVFLVLTIVTVGYMVMMGSAIAPLNSKDIIAFEFSVTVNRANVILDNWQSRGLIDNALLSLYLDFIFLILYSVTLTWGCRWASGRLAPGKLRDISQSLSTRMWQAAVLDAIENCCLLMLLQQYTWSILPVIAAISAAIKFVLVISALIIIIISLTRIKQDAKATT